MPAVSAGALPLRCNVPEATTLSIEIGQRFPAQGRFPFIEAKLSASLRKVPQLISTAHSPGQAESASSDSESLDSESPGVSLVRFGGLHCQ